MSPATRVGPPCRSRAHASTSSSQNSICRPSAGTVTNTATDTQGYRPNNGSLGGEDDLASVGGFSWRQHHRPRHLERRRGVAGYRSQSDAEFSFRQLKDPHVVSFSPMHHWTDHNIRVHTQTCVFALMIAHLLRRKADQAGLHLSVRELLDQLAGIQETVLIYPSTGGRPKARRMLTETSTTQD